MAGKPSACATAPRLSKHLACLCHACCFGASSVAPLSPRRVTTRLCCRSLFLGTTALVTMSRHHQGFARPKGLGFRHPVEPVSLAPSASLVARPPCYAMLRLMLLRCLHHTPSSNRSLLCLFGRAKRSRLLSAWVTARRFFQNLVAFAYTQRFCHVWSAHKCAPARTSQSSHAPHPALSRCLIDLGVSISAFPQRVETEKKGTTMHTIRNIVLQDTQCQWCGDYAVIECTTCDHMECDTCGAGGYCDCIGGQTNE